MNAIQKIVMDLARPGSGPCFYAVQGDSGSRSMALELRCDGLPWPVPEGVQLLIRYRKPDGIGGTYDTLPDGRRAWSALGNVLTVLLAPQVCTVSGKVAMELTLIRGLQQLTTFRMGIIVSGKLMDGEDSEDYTNLAAWLAAYNGSSGSGGASVTAARIDDRGHLLITLSTGTVLDAGVAVGPAGRDGAPGADGATPRFSVGNVKTLGPGEPASVTMTGTQAAPVLNFGIPRGADGSGGSGGTGTPGADGEDGGWYTPAVTQPDQSTMVVSFTPSKAGMASVPNVSVTLPKGRDGADGADGQDGRTPVRGTDYWTAADIAQIRGYVNEAILGGAW